ncbi:hypothetical protein SDRG_04654 [Saprolegnia diclina VS20]|uniref:Uncharacterized protein n=1 Tax=Saprolegnia diclina (strain VS20) TaxID=1156394 RepID=T0S665_SAPDV|nr:hypothetical protein SDRG_04654 [Saprolegnia diclina VS20]EQC38227.1 hypothetical protein SDRG_04654 [Saprolegnia diclina VS20]|eukprot:XP_008608554.1 hypothetical protein SDRG_04654 [Saprolegnia diclina VS20]
MEGYLRFRGKCKEWQAAHDKVIRLVTAFQSQIGKTKEVEEPPTVEDEGMELLGLHGYGGNRSIDGYLAEGTLAALKAYPRNVQDLLLDMYDILEETQKRIMAMSTSEAVDTGPSGMQVSAMQYLRFIKIELDMYESEYQQIAITMASMEFATATGAMNAFMTSLSTQPFINIDTILAITEQHNFSYQLLKAEPKDEWV